MSEKFWLYNWIDSKRIRKLSHAEKLLKSDRAIEEIQTLAKTPTPRTEISSTTSAPLIVAGAGMDLSGHLGCDQAGCLKKQVDNLFSHVLHYFDKIVVMGPDPNLLFASSPSSIFSVKRTVLNYVELLLYIRDIGAEDLLVFHDKPVFCREHHQENLRKAGMGTFLEDSESYIQKILDESELVLKPLGDRVFAGFMYNGSGPVGLVEPGVVSNRERFRRGLAKNLFERYLGALSTDVAAARQWKAPLGATRDQFGPFSSKLRLRSSIDDVAFEVGLPVLRGIEPKILIRVRQDEKDAFDRFRHALRRAIAERLQNRTNDAAKIAIEISNDLIQPEIRQIAKRLKSANRLFLKKAGQSVAFGMIPAACGLFVTNPVLSAAAVAAGLSPAVTTILNAAHRRSEQRDDVTFSDMYFVWKAHQHRNRAASRALQNSADN
jgi:hypothetical protein